MNKSKNLVDEVRVLRLREAELEEFESIIKCYINDEVEKKLMGAVLESLQANIDEKQEIIAKLEKFNTL